MKLLKLFSHFVAVAVLIAATTLADQPSAIAQTSSSNGLVYHGRIMKPNNQPLEEAGLRFVISIYGRNNALNKRCLLFQEEQNNVDMTNSMGVFEIRIGEGNRLMPAVLPGGLSRVFLNSLSYTQNNVTCDDASTTFVADSLDRDREIEVSIQTSTGTISIPAQKIRAVPWAMQAMEIGGYSADYLLKLDGVMTQQFPAAGMMFLRNAVEMSAGAPTGRLTNITDPVNASDVATKAYVDASLAGSVVPGQGIAVSGATVSTRIDGTTLEFDGAGVMRIRDSGISTAKLANGSVTFAKLSGGACAAGTVMTYDGASWGCSAPAAPNIDTSQITSGVLPVARGGTNTNTFAANKVIVSNGTGTALTGFSCAVGETIKFDASGVVGCYPDSGIAAGSAAGGDLTGTYPNPTLAQKGAGIGQVMKWDGDSWEPAADLDTNTTYSAAAPVTLSAGVFGLQACANGEILKHNGTNWICQTDNGLTSEVDPTVLAFAKNAPSANFSTAGNTLELTNTGIAAGSYAKVTVDAKGRVTGFTTLSASDIPALGGDLTGTIDNATVARIRGANVNTTGIAAGKILKYNGTEWVMADDAGAAGSVASLTANAPLSVDQSTGAVTISIGDASAVAKGAVQVGTGLNVAAGVVSANFGSAAGTITQGNDPRLSDSRAPIGAAAGDLAGTYPNPTLAQKGATAGQVLKWDGDSWEPSADTDTNTTYTANAPLTLAAGAFGLQACANGEVLKYNGTNWVCSPDATGGAPADATTSTKGIVQIGTGINVAAGVISANFGTAAGTIAQGNDARFTDSRTPIGAAAGDLAGTYPNPTLAQKGATSGQVLKWDGDSWEPAADAGLTSETDPTVPSWAKNANLLAADVPNLDAAKITSGVLPVSRGGTNSSNFAANKIIVSNATGNTLTGFSCAVGETIKFDASGVVGCYPDSGLTAETDPSVLAFAKNAPNATNFETTGNILNLTNTGVVAGVYTKVTVDGKGRVTTGANLAATDIPDISANYVAVGASAGGDLAGTYPSPTLAQKGATSGQVMKWNGTAWAPAADTGITSESDPTVTAWAKAAPAARLVTTGNVLDLSTVGTAGTYKSVTVDAYGRITAGTNPTTLAGYGITDAVTNGGGTPSVTTGTFAARPAFGTAGRIYIDTTNNAIYRDTGSAWVAIGDGVGTGDVTDVTGVAPLSVANSTGPNPQISIAACASGEILKYNGSAWVCSTDATGGTPADATTSTKGIVQVGTGINVAAGVISANFGTAAGTIAQGNDSRFTDARTPMGAAGGDLTGTYPNPTLAQKAATSGQVLKWDGDSWEPAADTDTNTTYTAGNGLSELAGAFDVNVDNTTVEINADSLRVKDSGITSAKIADGTIALADLNAMGATNGQILKYNGSAWTVAADDTGGTPADATTSSKGIMQVGTGLNVAAGVVSVAYGTAAGTAVVGNDARLSDARTPMGAAGGDLTGTYPNPNLSQKGATSGQVLKWDGDSWEPAVDAGITVETDPTVTAWAKSAPAARMVTTGNVLDLANVGTAGTYRSVTVDAYGRVTAGTNPTTLSGYGITDAVSNAGGTPSVQTGLLASRPAFGTAGRLYIASDNNTLYRDTGSAWVAIGDGTGSGGDITDVVAGAALTGGGTSGSVTVDVAVDNVGIEVNADALRIKDLGVTTAKLADGSVTAGKLNQMAATSGQVLKWNGSAWAPGSDDTGGTPADATTSSKGIMQVGTGLNVAAGVVSVAYGTAAGTAVVGNDARLSDSRTPSGAAGGDLTGTYPNPTIAAGVVDTTELANGAVTAAKLNQMAATSGQVLKWNGSAWAPAADSGVASETDPTVTAWAKAAPAARMVTTGNVLDLATVGTAGTYRSVTVDAYGRVTAGTNPTTLSGYGITDAVSNAGGTPSVQTGLLASRPAFGTAGRLYIASDNNTLYRDTGSAWVAVGDGTGSGGDLTEVQASAPLSVTNGTGPIPSLSLAAGTVTGQTLRWNGTNWVSAQLAATDITGTSSLALAGDVTGTLGASSVDRIRGTTVTVSALANNHMLQYNGTAWVNRAIPTCAAGNYLTFNGTTWSCAADTTGGTPADATTSSKGIVQIGTGINVAAGVISANFGTAAGTIAQGNDSRFTDARTPTGAAGGDLTGTYPNPTLAAGVVNTTELANGAVTAAKLNQMAATSGQVLKWNGTAWAPAADTDTGITVETDPTVTAWAKAAPAARMVTTGNVLDLANVGTAGTYKSVTVDAYGRVTAGTNPTTLAGYGITDAVSNAGGTPSVQTGLLASRPAFGTTGRLYIASDNNTLYRDTGSAWVAIGDGTGSTADATTSSKGIVQIGTGINVAAGVISANFGTAAGTIAQGNDSRFTDARAPTGAAGGDLTGTYPNPTIAASAVGSTEIANGSVAAVDLETATNGQLFIGNGTGFTKASLTAGTGISITPGAGSISIAATNNGDITDVTASAPLSVANSTGPNPAISIAAGTVTGQTLRWNGTNWVAAQLAIGDVTGTVPVSRGGTGATSFTANKVIVSDATGTTLTPLSCAVGQVIGFDASGVVGCYADQTGGSMGTGTANRVTKWLTGTTIGNAGISDASDAVAIAIDVNENINLAGNIAVKDAATSTSIAINSAATMGADGNRYGINNTLVLDATANLTAARTHYGAYNNVTSSLTDANLAGFTSAIYGSYNRALAGATAGAAGAATTMVGSFNYALNQSASTTNMSNHYGSYNYANITGTGTTSNLYGTQTLVTNNNAGSAVTSAYGYNTTLTNTAGTIGNAYLFKGAYSGTGITTEWGIHLTGETKNTFSGDVGIGTLNPAHKLDVVGNVNATQLCIAGTCKAAWDTSATPSGAAGGDLTGTYPNPTIAAGVVGSTEITDASIVNADVAVAANIDITKLGTGVVTTTEFNYLNGVTSSVQTQLNAKVANGGGTPSVTTGLLASRPAFGTAGRLYIASDNNTLYRDTGTAWVAIGDGTGGAPTGAAGGDLTGTYPNPTLAAGVVNTTELANGAVTAAKLNQMAATSGQVLKWNGTAWAPAADDNTVGVSGTGTANRVSKWTSATAQGNSGISDASDAVAMTIDATENVGIGVAPGAKLHVASGTGASSASTILATSTNNSMMFIPQISGGSYSPMSVTNDSAIIAHGGAQDTGGLYLGIWSASPKGIRILNTGDVGIGTATLNYPGLQVGSGGTGGGKFLTINGGSGTAGGSAIILGANSSNPFPAAIGMQSAILGGALNTDLMMYHNSGNIIMSPGGAEKARFGASGYALDVTGTVRASGEIISTNANQFRMVQGNYGAFYRNDGSDLYTLLTNSADPYGSWNALRPFTINLPTGNVNIGSGALLVTHGGNVSGPAAPTAGAHLTNKTYVDAQVGAKVGGSGTANVIPKFTAAGTIGNSIASDIGGDLLQVSANFGAHVSGTSSGGAIFGSNMYVSGGNHMTKFAHASYGYSGIKPAWGNIYFYAQNGATAADTVVAPAPRMTIANTGAVSIASSLTVGTTITADNVNDTTGNFHLDGNGVNSTYINWFGGSGGVRIGNGASGYGSLFAGDVTAYGSVSVSGDVTSSSMYTSNWFRSTGNSGWYNATHGGGIYMTDSTWIRVYNNKNFYVGSGILSTDGSLGVGTSAPAYKADIVGAVRASAYYFTSDQRLKTNVDSIKGLELILKMRGVKFDWIKTGEHDIGLIAQEVEKVAPDLVSTDPTGYKSVKYGNIVAPLIEATKELHSKYEILSGDISKYADQLVKVDRRVASLELKLAEKDAQLKKQQEEIDLMKKQIEAIMKKVDKK